MTQEDLRELLIERTKREKQVYISEQTGIDKDTLSKFTLGKISELYPHLFRRLEEYLTSNK